MKYLLIAVIFSIGNARIIENNCDGVIVHNINHEKEVLKDKLNMPYQLAIDYDTNKLFFSYSAEDSGDVFNSAFINLKTDTFKIITGVDGGFANAVDSKKHLVYLGGRNGLYNFNFETEQADHIEGCTYNIWQLFYKDNVYFTTYPDETAYVYKNGVSQIVPELEHTKVLLIALDNNDNIYYSNSSGLFVYKKAKNYVSYIGDYNLNGVTSDINGNLFFSTPGGIYFIKDTYEVEKLTSIDDVYGLAIEADGSIIYAAKTSITRLKPTKNYCYLNEKELMA